MKVIEVGKEVTLNEPYLGYHNGVILERIYPKWAIKLHGSGMIIYLYDDEFIID